MGSALVTPEAVLLELPTVGTGSRAFARLVDLVIQVVVGLLLAAALGFGLGNLVGVNLIAIGSIFTTVLVLPIATEILWRGRSPGKALFGLRVVGADGSPEAPRQAVIRGLVALVDLFVSLGFVALATSMFSTGSQRSGDMAAGTVVIRTRSGSAGRTPIAFHPPVGYESYVSTLDVGLLNDEDFSLVREFLLRCSQLTVAERSDLALSMANAVRERIRHSLPGQIDPELWLVCVASAYQLREGGLLADAAAGLAPLAPRPPVPTGPR